MKNLLFSKRLFLLLSVVFISVRSSSALAEFPEKGQYAVGFSAGLSEPFASAYSAGWTVNASFDTYVSNHIGLRGTAGYSRSSTDLGGAFWKGSFLASAVYPFDLGSVHPFARAGIGLYLVSPPGESNRARLGAHIGGGAEWFFRRRVSLTGEGVFHVLTNVVGRGASSFELTAGVRYYF